MRKSSHRLSNLTKITCVSPRIYQTITQTLKHLLRPFYRPLIRPKHPPLNKDKKVTKLSVNIKTPPSNNGLWMPLRTPRVPKNPNHLWAYVKTPEEYLDGELSKDDELILQNLLTKS